MTRWRILIATVALTLALTPQAVSAHGPGANAGTLGAALTTWSPDPAVLLLAFFSAALYVWARRRLKRTAPCLRFSHWRPAAFVAGLLLLIVALASPIDAYSDDLFWAHMLQHVLIMVAAAPLMLLGAPATLAWAAATPHVRRVYLRPILCGRPLAVLTTAPVTLGIFIGVTWLWHLPALYDAAVRSEAIHTLEHLTFLSVSLLFWWLVIDIDPTRLRPGHVVRAATLLVAIIQGIVLGVILISLDAPVYDTYITAAALRDWGPDALADQRSGAGLVWIPSGLVFALAVLITFHNWMDRLEAAALRDDRARLRLQQFAHRAASTRHMA